MCVLHLRHWLCLLLSSIFLLGTSHAATPPPPPAQAMMDALNRATTAVVGVKVLATEDARSAETLGLRRAGSGVLISQDGLILTIGYLMLEAEQIEIVTQDNKTLPARAVAYDLATGFGLVRPLLPLRNVAVAALGSSRDLQPGEPLMAVTGPQAGRRRRREHDAAGQPARVFGQLGIPHRIGAVHQPAGDGQRRQPQRRAALSTSAAN
jgi:serine protease Do